MNITSINPERFSAFKVPELPERSVPDIADMAVHFTLNPAVQKRLERARKHVEKLLLPKGPAWKMKSRPKGRLLGRENITSVSTGFKTIKGQVHPVPCVVVHVEIKAKEPEQVSAAARLAAGELKGFPGIHTDVVVTEKNRSHRRPAFGGETLVRPGIFNGTLTCLVKRPVSPGVNGLFVLGCNHTLAGLNTGVRNHDPVIQPSLGALPTDVIGQLTDYVDLQFNGSINEVDCAIARTDPARVDPRIALIGAYNHVPQLAAVGMGVIAVGAATNRIVFGIVESISHPAIIDYSIAPPIRARFQPLIKIRPTSNNGGPFSVPGDSGALVLASIGGSFHPVGMIVSGDGDFSYGCHYATVLARLGATYLTPDDQAQA